MTGCPRLPVGGLKNLRPQLAIIRIPVRNPHGNEKDSTQLPSAMTCTNYLKLPDYRDKELMRRKLVYAMREAQSGFQLS